MKRLLAALISICIALTVSAAAFADYTQKKTVSELYSVDGYYEDEVGNTTLYSFHVPQIASDTPAAKEINEEIAEQFSQSVEEQFLSMENGLSLWMWRIAWRSFWEGSRLFLLITLEQEGNFTEYAAFGYDFKTAERITNETILNQREISEEEYLENLQERVQFMFEDMYQSLSEELRQAAGYDELLKKTIDWANMDCPMFINQFGEIETIVRIASIAGAEWYYHLATPFVAG